MQMVYETGSNRKVVACTPIANIQNEAVSSKKQSGSMRRAALLN